MNLDALRRLGLDIERRWASLHRSEAAFSRIVRAALSEVTSEPFSLRQVLQDSVLAPKLANQGDPKGEFGDPPLTVYAGDGFNVDLLFWLDGTTSIHQHSFVGIFQVLTGSSIHTSYTFSEQHRVNSRLAFGVLNRKSTEVLRVGDTRDISAGDGMIHSLFHMDRPSVTLCVRTTTPLTACQFTYWPSGVAVDPFYNPTQLRRRFECLRLLAEVDEESYRITVSEYLSSADIESVVRFVEFQISRIGYDDWFKARLQGLKRFGEWATLLVTGYDAFARATQLIQRRRLIRNVEHRFFLGLLLTLPDRPTILREVAERYPGDPIGTVLRWIRELSSTSEETEPVGKLGIPADEAALAVLERLLRGMKLEEVIADLKVEFDAADVDNQRDELRELCLAFAESHVFGPLLTAEN